MHAWACQSAGAALAPFEYPPAPLGDHGCEIRITHCGVCHSDLHLVDDDWGITPYPLVPGHEIVGVVTEAGPHARVAPGQRVATGWQRSACLACDQCDAGLENLCAQQQATCVGHPGGFASHIRTDGRFVFAVPDELESAHAAPLMCGGITVYAPLRRFHAGPGMRVGVIGIGGLGHLALQFAHALGAEVTALSSSPDKEAEARGFGADHFVVTRDPAAVKAHAGTFDLLLSTVSADQPWPLYLTLLRPRGTLCVVGVPQSPLELPAFSLIKAESSVSGGAIGGRARIVEMLGFAARHGIAPQIEVMPMAAVNDALARLAAGHARYRIVLEA